MQFSIEASTTNPEMRQGYERDNLADYSVTTSRAKAAANASAYLRRGLWVEVYNDETKELLAGPLDPDQPTPAYIV